MDNQQQFISPSPKMKLIVEEFDGGEIELILFQVKDNVFQIFDINAANRWVDTRIKGNGNWTFDDYARLIDSHTLQLVKIIKGGKVYEREILHLREREFGL